MSGGRIWSEVVKSPDTEQGAVSAVDILCVMLCGIMLKVGENRAAIGQS